MFDSQPLEWVICSNYIDYSIILLIRDVTSFPWALVQGSRKGPCLTFKEYNRLLAMRSYSIPTKWLVWSSLTHLLFRIPTWRS